MRDLDVRISVAFAALLALAACGEKKVETRAAPPVATAPAPAPAPQEPTSAPAASPDPTASATPTPTPTPSATPTPAPSATASAPKPVPAPAPVPAPKAEPAAPAPAPAASAHPKVGADKCKMCHRLQHQSWAASPHATKALDCEGCHGNGGDYWPASVMRDRAKAVAAGLVNPDLASCRKCHASADAALFAKVHAHKAK